MLAASFDLVLSESFSDAAQSCIPDWDSLARRLKSEAVSVVEEDVQLVGESSVSEKKSSSEDGCPS